MGTAYATGDPLQREVSWGRAHTFQLFDPPLFTALPPRLVNIDMTGTRAWVLRVQLIVTNIGGGDNFEIGVRVSEGMGSDSFDWSRPDITANFEPVNIPLNGEKIFVDPLVDVTNIGGGAARMATLRAWCAPISRAGIDTDYSLPPEAWDD